MKSTTQAPVGETAVQRSYDAIMAMVHSFQLRPGERLNESSLSRELGVSRTPLREAMNRLVSENVLDFVPTKGFFRKVIKPREIYELYELRLALESAGARIAVVKSSDEDIDRVGAVLRQFTGIESQPFEIPRVVPYDELFHETIMSLSGNSEMLNALRSVNIRIRALRYLGVGASRFAAGQKEHRQIYSALKRRDADAVVELLTTHIGPRLEEVERNVRELYGRIYVG
ncbi:GntR family transcriptional regulator [Paraburkholderia aromaticivorans]|uniref:HTH gntR-type domain-containing protein n=1 Tax=Paraburkholderia aromaticivorans TaxID=2026199 RepID=A0A248W067_9BURK|nr:GntR family transcriptional regulator [Paraburkholderia aromaticivorans]ASW04142.1 hypothetical protein CJU94_38930 [Paraburkholderia aromaticivorans]